MRINFLRNRYSTSLEDKEILELRYQDFVPYLKSLIYVALKQHFGLTFDSVPPCIFSKIGVSDLDVTCQKFILDVDDYIEKISNINMEHLAGKSRKKMI